MAKLRDTIVEITVRVTVSGLLRINEYEVPNRLTTKDITSVLRSLSAEFQDSIKDEDGLIDLKADWHSDGNKRRITVHSYNLNHVNSLTGKPIKKPKEDENI